MNLNRAVNCLYISLDGQILKKVIRWQHNELRIVLRIVLRNILGDGFTLPSK